MATHELGGLDFVAKMDTHYSTRQLYNFIEMLDVHDAIKKNALDKVKAEANKKR